MLRNLRSVLVLSAAALLATACGGSSPTAVTSQRVGASGAIVQASGGLRVEIPAGALQQEIEIQIREVEPGRGSVKEFQLEPAGHELAKAARISIATDDTSGRIRMVEVENEVEHGIEAEAHDAAGHEVSGEIHRLGRIGLTPADDAQPDDKGVDAPPDAAPSAPAPADDKGVHPSPHG